MDSDINKPKIVMDFLQIFLSRDHAPIYHLSFCYLCKSPWISSKNWARSIELAPPKAMSIGDLFSSREERTSEVHGGLAEAPPWLNQ
jgi:hypothetical protein